MTNGGQASSRDSSADDSKPAGPRRILIADDEHLIARGIVTSLASLGYEIVGPAADGHEAIHLAEEHEPDLCLLDVRMPEMDGLDAAAVIWEQFEIPSIILTAYSNDTYVGRAMRAGAYGYLLKPVTVDSLRAAIPVAWTRWLAEAKTRERLDKAERTLASRREIEQAKWKLVQTTGCDEPTAHSCLQKHARRNRMLVGDVARAVLAGTLDPSTIMAGQASAEKNGGPPAGGGASPSA